MDQYLRAITHLDYLTFALHAWLHIAGFHLKMHRQHAKRHFLIEKLEKEGDNQGSFLRFYSWTSFLKWQVWCNGSFNFLEPDDAKKHVHYFCWKSRSPRSFQLDSRFIDHLVSVSSGRCASRKGRSKWIEHLYSRVVRETIFRNRCSHS